MRCRSAPCARRGERVHSHKLENVAPLKIGTALCWLTLVLVGCDSDVPDLELPIEEDFDGEYCSWPEGDLDDVTIGCEDDQYMVLFKRTEQTAEADPIITQTLEPPVDSVAVEADITLRALSGANADDSVFAGLACMGSPSSHGYAFFVGADGTGVRRFAIAEVNGTVDYFVDERSDAVAGVGATNHVRGECRTNGQVVELTMFLNGSQVGTASDPDGRYPFNGVDFLVLSPNPGTEVRYDNFSAENLAEGDSD